MYPASEFVQFLLRAGPATPNHNESHQKCKLSIVILLHVK